MINFFFGRPTSLLARDFPYINARCAPGGALNLINAIRYSSSERGKMLFVMAGR